MGEISEQAMHATLFTIKYAALINIPVIYITGRTAAGAVAG